MEAKVIRPFRDSKDKNRYAAAGSTWEGTKARLEEINDAGQKRFKADYLQIIEEEPKTSDKKTKERKLDTETK